MESASDECQSLEKGGKPAQLILSGNESIKRYLHCSLVGDINYFRDIHTFVLSSYRWFKVNIKIGLKMETLNSAYDVMWHQAVALMMAPDVSYLTVLNQGL